MRAMLTAAVAIALSGCLTSGGMREIRTNPPGALVTIDGYGECETPCTVKLDEPRYARIAKAGYVAKTYLIEPGRGPIELPPLELAAASDDVDTTGLPDIE